MLTTYFTKLLVLGWATVCLNYGLLSTRFLTERRQAGRPVIMNLDFGVAKKDFFFKKTLEPAVTVWI